MYKVNSLKKIIEFFSNMIGRRMRNLTINKNNRKKLRNKDFTIISQNCIGSIIYHDLNLEFKSPTINMLFEPNGFADFLLNYPSSLDWKIEFVKSEKKYPVGYIGSAYVEFVHYENEKEVIDSWKRRKAKINKNNVYIVSCIDDMLVDKIEQLDKLPYKKILFTTTNDKLNIKNTVYINCFEKADARLINYCNVFGNRYIDKYIDIVEWLNKESDYEI